VTHARGAGFTLVEVVFALAVAGVVLTAGAIALRAVTDGARALTHRDVEDTRRWNARRWLARTLRSVEVGTPVARNFEGEPSRVRFTSRVLVANGWWEPRDVELALAGSTLRANVQDGESVDLAGGLQAVEFDYLLTPGLETHWARAWRSPTSAPVAVRIRLVPADSLRSVDTLLLVIGERG
jgi:prepilin-type N-terminal cleavage/methylation domain-containing protein